MQEKFKEIFEGILKDYFYKEDVKDFDITWRKAEKDANERCNRLYGRNEWIID